MILKAIMIIINRTNSNLSKKVCQELEVLEIGCSYYYKYIDLETCMLAQLEVEFIINI